MYRLKEWFLEQTPHGFRGHGNCYENPQFVSGEFITTSHIMRIEVEEEAGQLKLFTRSGSCYVLEYADMDEAETESTQKALADMKIPVDWQSCVALRKEKIETARGKITELLHPNELYVIMTCGGKRIIDAYFKKEDGGIAPLSVTIHTGMFQDSIIIADYDTGLCDWRIWSSFFGIEPYHWSDGLVAVYIENDGDNFVLKGSAREIVCKTGEVTVIKSEEYTGEGLCSPDVVNGKGLYTKMLSDDWAGG